MSDEYVVKVSEAIALYHCLATMQIGGIELSVNLGYEFLDDSNQYRFAVKNSGGKYALLKPELYCIVTFEDYTARIFDFTARQLLVSTWLAKHLAAKIFNKALAREKLEWEAELVRKSEDTGKIPIIEIDEEDEL